MARRRWSEMISLNVYWFAISYLWNSLGPLVLPLLVAGLVPEGVKGSALGLLTAVGMVVAIVVQPLAGAISDRSASRWGRRRPFMVGGTLVDMVFLVAIALAPRYWFLLVAYFGLQVASNVAHGPYQGLIPDRVPPERWGQASGIKQLAEILGIIVTSLATGWLLSRGQVLLAILAIMAMLLVTLTITVLGVKEEPLPKAEAQAGPAAGSWLAQAWRTLLETFRIDQRRYSGFVWVLVSRLFIVVAMNLVRNYILYYIQHLLHMTAVQAADAAGTLMAILAVAIAIIVYPAGALSDRLGRKPLVVASGLVGAAGSLLLLLARSYTHLLLFGGVLGLSIGIFLSVNWALLTDLVPQEESGRYLGISNLATAGAGAVAGIGGAVMDVFNAQAPGRGYLALYVLAAACYLVGTGLLAEVREARRVPA